MKSIYDLVDYSDKEIKAFMKKVLIDQKEDLDWDELNYLYYKLTKGWDREDVDDILDFGEFLDYEDINGESSIEYTYENNKMIFELLENRYVVSNSEDITKVLEKIFESMKLVISSFNDSKKAIDDFFGKEDVKNDESTSEISEISNKLI